MWIIGITVLVATTAFAGVAPKTAAQRRGLNFSHTLHVEANSVDCATCHGVAAKSQSGNDNLLPGHLQCVECHDVETANGCAMCHLSATPKEQPAISDYSPKFGHIRHVEKAKLTCGDCHKDLDKPLDADHRGHFPKMADCLACHDQRKATTECSACHTSDDSRKPQDHLVNWLNRHGAAASMAEEQQCNQCHGHSNIVECQSCHTGDPVFFPHPRNYIARHGQDAHLSDLRCATCHEQREFCNECHRQNNVLPSGHFRPGWVTTDGGEHSTEAGFDLESCMSCHESPSSEPICARCHGK
jgi:hypothetical protein